MHTLHNNYNISATFNHQKTCCIYLAVYVPLQAFLISILYHFSDLLDERIPLTLQDKLALDLDVHTSTQKQEVTSWLCERFR